MRPNRFEGIAQSWARYQDYVPLWTRDSSEHRQQRRLKGFTIVGLSLLIIIFIPVFFLSKGSGSEDGNVVQHRHHQQVHWTKPSGLNIVALVFYGRRANVQILERYLRVHLDLMVVARLI